MTSKNIRFINQRSAAIYKAKRLGLTLHDTQSGLILRRFGRIEHIRHSYPALNELLDELGYQP